MPVERRTILVVDDAESICIGVAQLLGIDGFDCLTAFNGEDGLRQVREHRPDAVLLDIMMPGLDGWGVIRELKADPESARIPVVALTALPLSDEQLSAAGFQGYLRKPVPPHLLREEVRRACNLTGTPR